MPTNVRTYLRMKYWIITVIGARENGIEEDSRRRVAETCIDVATNCTVMKRILDTCYCHVRVAISRKVGIQVVPFDTADIIID